MDEWQQIRYDKIVDDKIEHTSYGTPVIIRACFEHCSKSIKNQLEMFLSNSDKQRKTLCFSGFKIRLTKWEDEK